MLESLFVGIIAYSNWPILFLDTESTGQATQINTVYNKFGFPPGEVMTINVKYLYKH
jgi:hypothetical protein